MRSPASSEPSGRDRGQATVELAIVLPLVILLALVLVHLAAIVGQVTLAQLAAREGARAAVVAASPASAATAAARRVLGATPASIDVRVGAATVTVAVTIRAAPATPLVGRWLPAVTVRGEASMALEPVGVAAPAPP